MHGSSNGISGNAGNDKRESQMQNASLLINKMENQAAAAAKEQERYAQLLKLVEPVDGINGRGVWKGRKPLKGVFPEPMFGFGYSSLPPPLPASQSSKPIAAASVATINSNSGASSSNSQPAIVQRSLPAQSNDEKIEKRNEPSERSKKRSRSRSSSSSSSSSLISEKERKKKKKHKHKSKKKKHKNKKKSKRKYRTRSRDRSVDSRSIESTSSAKEIDLKKDGNE